MTRHEQETGRERISMKFIGEKISRQTHIIFDSPRSRRQYAKLEDIDANLWLAEELAIARIMTQPACEIAEIPGYAGWKIADIREMEVELIREKFARHREPVKAKMQYLIENHSL